jgi:hypothetical protein
MNDLKRYLQVRIQTANREFTVDLASHLPIAGIQSLNQVREVQTSIYFPPATYRNTGRTAEMPADYQCHGSGSCIIRLEDQQERALSLVLFHDTTMHGKVDATEHVNAYIYGWPVGMGQPDWTKNIECHKLPVGEEITIMVAPDTDRELRATVCAPFQHPKRIT